MGEKGIGRIRKKRIDPMIEMGMYLP